MESLGLAPAVMRRRVEESLDLLGLTDVRQRPLRTLSGGQQQRAAIASVLAQHPRVLVLDEPTSALDPGAAEEVLAALQRLVHDLGLTVLMAEHRLERVVQFADRIVHVHGDGSVTDGLPGRRHGRRTGRTAGRRARPLGQVGAAAAHRPGRPPVRWTAAGHPERAPVDRSRRRSRSPRSPGHPSPSSRECACSTGSDVALNDVDLQLQAGEIVAVMGRNGAGKSTLLRSLVGLADVAAGQVSVTGHDPAAARRVALTTAVGMVPQDPGDLLWNESVRQECDESVDPAEARRLLAELAPGVDPAMHPRDLSEGQRLALALAVVLSAGAPLLLLDEPTRGLDYPTKHRLVGLLRRRAASGGTVVVATHDVELAADLATRTVVIAEGEIVTDGPTRDVVTASPQFAPQVAKVLAPVPMLTVADVLAALPEAL